MNVVELLKELSTRGMRIWKDGDRLRYRVSEEALTPDLLDSLKLHKQEILDLLQDGVSPARFYPLSYGQKGLWFLYRSAPQSPAYNVGFTARIDSIPDIAALRRAFQTLINRHACLRTRFTTLHGEPIQEILDEQEVYFEQIDVSGCNEDDIKQQVLDKSHRPFNLKQGPPFRVHLFRRTEHDHILLLAIHHIIFDGWSLWVLLDDLRKAYSAESTGSPSSLEPLKLSYIEYVQKEDEILAGPVGDKLWAYWQQKLSGDLPTLQLPTDFPRPSIRSFNGASCSFQLSEKLSGQLKEFAHSKGVTLYMLLLAALNFLLCRYTGQKDLIVGSPNMGQIHPEFNRVVGYFMNMLALRITLSGDPSCEIMLDQTRQTVLEALDHQEYPFSLLVEKLQPIRDPSRTPVVEVVLNVLVKKSFEAFRRNGTVHHAKPGELIMEPYGIPQQEGQTDLYLELVETDRILAGSLKYNADLFHENTIKRLIDAYCAILEVFIHHPDTTVSQFHLPEDIESQTETARAVAGMRLHHIGFACRGIQRGIQHIEDVYQVKHISEIVSDRLQHSEVCLIETEHGVTIELVAGEEVEHLLQRGVMLYQVCYEVPDIFRAIDHFKNNGAVMVSEPKPAKLFKNRLVAFLDTELGLIELLEGTPSERSREIVRQAFSSEESDIESFLAITSTFTAEPLEDVLEFWGRQLNLPVRVKFTPYNQVFQQLLDPSSLLMSAANGLNVVLVRFSDWLRYQPDSRITPETSQKIEQSLQELIVALQSAAERSATPFLLCLCPDAPEDDAEPNYALAAETMRQRLRTESASITGLSIVLPDELTTTYPVDGYYEAQSDKLGHIPYTPDFFAALGTRIARTYGALNRPPYKVIVLDCDGTLWKGVCGEDGPQGIELKPAYKALQEFMLAQHQAGMLLCIASKNNETDVLNVFEECADMLLKPEHFVAMHINWQPKSANIQALAEKLQLGLDSFIFVDDNPVECAEVQANCPDVLTLQLPQDEQKIPRFLRHIWAFDHLNVTQEDRRRTERYQQNLEREQSRSESITFSDFIASLELDIVITTMTPEQLPRVSQLTQRTNQFNMTTIRRSESDIQTLCATGGHECYTVDVSDRFGKYGLVGVMIVSTATPALQVDTLLLSCRALGRGVEHRMLAHLGRLAHRRGLNTVSVGYRSSEKNMPALKFLQRIGSTAKNGDRTDADSGTIFNFPIDDIIDLVFAPHAEEQPQAAASPPASRPSTARKRPDEHRILRSIAADLCDAAAIRAQITAHKRQSRPDEAGSFSAPRTVTEEVLAGIWADVLGFERIGIHDNFFSLGGHSLLGTQVISRINETFHIDLSLQELFEAQTIAELAENVETLRQAEGPLNALPPLRPTVRGNDIPLSFAQQRLWFISLLEPHNNSYNIAEAIRLTGPLDIAILEQSFNQIIRRHETLRTTFHAVNGHPVQRIAPEYTLHIVAVDLRSFPPERQSDEARELAAQEAQRAFDLGKGPLLRLKALQLSEDAHVLLITMHHIISDGWSLGVMVKEALRLYDAFSRGSSSPLPELPIQYADFAAWQREWLDSDVMTAQAEYWKDALAGAPPVLALPADRPRPAKQSFRGAAQHFEIPRQLSQQLASLSRQEGCTLFMTLLAAFNVLLYRYTGQEDIVIGSPIANRHRTEIEALIGFFVNTLVFRANLTGNPPFRDLLRQVRQTAFGHYMHQDLPYERVVDLIQPERNLSYNPVFQVMFIVQNAPIEEMAIPGLTITPSDIDTGAAMFDLTVSLRETPAGLTGSLQYNTDIFDSSRIARMIEHFQTLLGSITEAPQQRISEFSIMAPAERRRIVEEWNSATREYPRDLCIHHLFEQQVERTPDAIAVVFHDTRISYRSLNRRANRLAHHLQSLRVGPDVLVGLYIERSLDMVIGVLAILKAGGAYVPLDPAYPQERLAFMLADSRAKIVLTQPHLLQHVPEHAGTTICLDSRGTQFESHPDNNPVTATRPESLAYVIYTSGSTGTPKGVAMRHRPLVNLITWQLRQTSVGKPGNTAQFSPMSFDVSFQEIFSTWCEGGTLVLLSEQTRRDPLKLLACLRDHAVERLFLPFVALQQIAEAATTAAEQLPATLREVITAGEQLLITPAIERLFSRLESCTLCNQYGPSETHVATAFTLPASVETWPAIPPIGHPIDNACIYLLDTFLQPVPVGVPGEVYIGGDCLARGYLHRPDLTEKKFIDHPFAPGERLYKTGDLAQYLTDGAIQFLGRLDSQVKIRGFRVELGEIEMLVTQHPAVKTVAVMVREDRPGDKKLVAYIVPKDIRSYTSGEVRDFLKQRLPDYMIPAAFVSIDTLPMTPSGKVNLRALPPPETSGLEKAYVPPRSPLEVELTEIWADILNLQKIGIHDNFFEIGGHSLLATQVMARITSAFQQDVPLQHIFEHPTIAQLAEYIETIRWLARASSETSGEIEADEEEFEI